MIPISQEVIVILQLIQNNFFLTHNIINDEIMTLNYTLFSSKALEIDTFINLKNKIISFVYFMMKLKFKAMFRLTLSEPFPLA